MRDQEVKASEYRRSMVTRQLEPRGIKDPAVLDAFRAVPRHKFTPGVSPAEAYGDHPLPIGEGQTISQPYMVALMTQCLGLKGREKVLEIGAGSGYQAAILSRLAARVITVERIGALAKRAADLLDEMGCDNVEVKVGDGTLGWPEEAPYGGIMVTAGAPEVPEPLIAQLAEGGRLVIPVGGSWSQSLTVIEKRGGETMRREVCGCVFVPLIGKHGWKK